MSYLSYSSLKRARRCVRFLLNHSLLSSPSPSFAETSPSPKSIKMETDKVKQEERPSHELYTISPTCTPPPEGRIHGSYVDFTGLSNFEVPVAKSIRGFDVEQFKSSLPNVHDSFPPHLSARPTAPSPLDYSPFQQTSTQLPSTPPNSTPHVPRPPNAFMLFRSDFLKRGIIPADVERRQQNLSRIAGEVWNLMAPGEKAEWHQKAAQVLLEHQKKNPDYKFTPAPRGSRKGKGKGRIASECSEEDGIREIREKYTKLPGPAAPPSRRRKQANCRNTVNPKYPMPLSYQSAPSSPLSEPSYSPRMNMGVQKFGYEHANRMNAPRRPSTSLGFATGHSFKDASEPIVDSLHQYRSGVRPSSEFRKANATSLLRGFDSAASESSTSYCDPLAKIFQAPSHTNAVNSFAPGQDLYTMPPFDPSVDNPSNIVDPFLNTLYSGENFELQAPTFDETYLFGPMFSNVDAMNSNDLATWDFKLFQDQKPNF